MSDSSNQTATPSVESAEPISLKLFLLTTALWLPLACFVWFGARSVIVYPITRMARWMLDWWLPGVIHESSQYVHFFKFTALIPLPPGMTAAPGQIPAMDGNVNALLFTYGLGVFWALVMATPDDRAYSLARRWGIALAGWFILMPVQAASIVAHVARILFIDLGDSGRQLAAEHHVNLELVAYAYQAATLIVPMISALIVWALFHRRFIEHIRFDPLPGREPARGSAGHSADAKPVPNPADATSAASTPPDEN
ncbi:MAG: exosortase H-associated membrane protein [Lysobacterales bacterium]